ncbi:MAG TPA: S41 family peptidase [candidate division WOR-3 bacterium]|uniref:S41 family peptidase n=1 Tax=candidate division WOR-3 bacterium TaxID=2052148 RepID=A0A9C9EPN6_UNCW3|nr:S41 family peptidase [candidate division WOR-3 bacterium]
MKKKIIILVGLSLLCGIFIGSALWAKSDTYTQLRIFNKILKEIEGRYVDSIPSDSLIIGAIDGMINVLGDPHTDYLSKAEYEALMISTKGEFGGIGATIGKRNDQITVISPLEGTPAYRAGLLPGDAIIEVDGVPTKGKGVDVVVREIRGKPGTKVVLTISRTSISEPFEVEITRAIIKLDAVPYFGMIDHEIGYVQLASFSRRADSELKVAFDSLFSLGAQKIIFDLRLNSGGLLNEGVMVSEFFLPRNVDVVTTKGRLEGKRVFRTKRTYSYGDFPMITLVDGGSASASEIVAGALQDWERSLIIGTNTFGKGSVQHIIPFEDSTALRITTARWYTPSGRSIDKPPELQGTDLTDEAKDSLELEKKVFTTLGPLKRKVYGEGGITPDIVIEPPQMTSLETEIYTKGLNFDFVVQYTASHKNIDKNFEVTESVLDDFAAFLLKKGLEFNEAEFDSIKVNFKKRLKQDIYTNLWGLKEGYKIRVANDPLVKKAVEMLKEVKTQQELFRFVKGK